MFHDVYILQSLKDKKLYYEAYLQESDAKARERYLKTSMGKRVIKKQLSNFLKQIL